MLIDLFLFELHLEVDLLPDSLLTMECKGQIDAVQGHPVDVLLPLRPLPPDRAVARCTDVLVIPKSASFCTDEQ